MKLKILKACAYGKVGEVVDVKDDKICKQLIGTRSYRDNTNQLVEYRVAKPSDELAGQPVPKTAAEAIKNDKDYQPPEGNLSAMSASQSSNDDMPSPKKGRSKS